MSRHGSTGRCVSLGVPIQRVVKWTECPPSGHAFLWKNRIEHGDPSLGNLMYNPVNKCGVLTDFDLSILQWESRTFGVARTGTIPFMAIDLLSDKYWKGFIPRFYYHELESFVWILVYVFFLYKNKVRVPNPDVNVDAWRTSNHVLPRPQLDCSPP